ncbi:MAG: RluA family pseudouridine synthase [Actinomycetota bacterium]
MTTVRFHAGEAETGERVDAALAHHAGIARAAAQRALRTGAVTVNRLPARPSYRLVPGDEVAGEVGPVVAEPPAGEDIAVTVRYEDDRVLVVSKPAGLVTHPAGGHERGTLVNALIGRGGPLSGTGSARPGIVHRLDKDTSGLLLVAKDDAAHAALVDALARRAVTRRYLALVRGSMPAGSGTIDAPVGRHPARPRLMAVTSEGRPAVTHYRVAAERGGTSLLEVILETGRTHQIRVHLGHLGHPILGDATYGGKTELAVRWGATRPFLHAWALAFPHPDGGRVIEVADPLPVDLIAVLDRAGIEPPDLPTP